jgi:hypothetical protein
VTNPTDDSDRLKALFAPPIPDGSETPDCPPPDRLWQARAGLLPAPARRDIVDHMSACPACAEAWRVAGDLGAEPSTGGDVRPSRYWPQALAAAAVVLFAVGLFLFKVPTGDTARSGGEVPIRALTPEDRPLPRADCLLAWTAGPEGTLYEVTVATADLNVVARGRGLKEARFQVPEAALRDLPEGQSLVWKVEAQLPDGGRVASPAFFARLE